MRPIALKLSGLQSYRETQCVDFDKLGETGVFGIFGPTGAGKSSILDAITLALYGKVERAQNRTIGIMNNCERNLTVSFTFDLGVGSERLRYRVERRYKRVDEKSIASSYSRLFAVNGSEETPLADRDTDVTNRIREIIGLTVDDFTRAVVLPQGRFAEFLTLKGAERTQMLQRLFSLEAYGQLGDKVRTRLTEAEAQLSIISGEQTGLGDCSQDAVKSAKLEYDESARQVALDRSLLNGAKEDFGEKGKVWGWMEELAQLSLKEIQHDGLRPDIESAAKELEDAEASEPIRQLLTSQNESVRGLREAETLLIEAQAAYDAALAAKDEADAALESAGAKRDREQTSLFERKASLEQAISEQERLKEQEARLSDLYGKRELLRQEYRDATELLKKAESEFEGLNSAVRETRSQIDRLEIRPEYRQRIVDSQSRLEAIGILEPQVEENRRKLSAYGAELSRLQTDLADAQTADAHGAERLRMLEGRLAEHIGRKPGESDDLGNLAVAAERRSAAVREVLRLTCEIDGCRQRLVGLESELDAGSQTLTADLSLLGRLEEQLEADKSSVAVEKAELEDIIAKDLLSSMADELIEGRPCPLCGSVHHPSPVREIAGNALDGARARAVESEARLADTLNSLNDARTRAAKTENAIQHVKSRITEAEGVREPLARQLDNLWQTLPSAWRGADADGLRAFVKNEEEDLAAARNGIRNWQAEERALADALKAATSELTGLRLKISGFEGRIEGCRRSLEQEGSRLTDSESALARLVAEFDGLRGDIGRDRIPALFGELREREAALSELRQRMRVEQDLAVKAETDLKAQNEARNKLKETGSGLTATIDEREKQAKAVKDGLESKTGGGDAGHLLGQVESALAGLREELQWAQRNREAASENLQRTSADVASAGARYEACRTGCGQTSRNLELELARIGFESPDEAVGRLRDEDSRQDMRSRIRSYREREKSLQAERERLEGLLGGRSLTAEEWDDSRRSLQEADKRLQETLTRLGRAQMNLASLEGRLTRWADLEGRKNAFEERRLQLNRLAALLRGNSFVQFVSEEQMTAVVDEASLRLMGLTGQRYSLELEAGGDFSIRDNFNGGTKRAVGTLSGGETFLTSLSLAIALSTQIQLRGRCPLEFFFLDEGFGTLDPELMDTVMSALERLHMNRMLIGIISHVPELRARMARRLVVEPAQASGRGSRLVMEIG